MPLTSSILACLITASLVMGDDQPFIVNSTNSNLDSDVKRRNELVDEAFLEQKDILLNMLENKLKEVRDNKKKKPNHTNGENNPDFVKCEMFPNNVDLKLKANGISVLGEADLLLKFGKSDTNTLNLNSSGISNVGKSQLNLDVNDGSLNIPRLFSLFQGKKECNKSNGDLKELKVAELKVPIVETRRMETSDNATLTEKEINDDVNNNVTVDSTLADSNNSLITDAITATTLNENDIEAKSTVATSASSSVSDAGGSIVKT